MADRIVKAKPAHEVTYQELVALVNRHAHEMSSIEVLAVAANMVGKLIAIQDQNKTTADYCMQVVIHNLEMGNQAALEAAQAMTPKGNA